MDSSPLVIKEAMAMGIATVSTTISGIPELIGDCGFSVSPENHIELFNAIEKVYLMNNDEKNKLSKKARDRIKTKFNITIEVKKLLDLFTKTSQKIHSEQ